MNNLTAGMVMPYLGAPTNLNALATQGWLNCDGSSLSTTQYGKLYNAIGVSFGSTGTGYFNLPDLRGVFLRGIDPKGAVDPDYAERTSPVPGNATVVGPLVGSRQGQQVQNHQHNWDANFGQISDGGSDLNIQLALNSPGNSPDLGTQPTTNVDGGGNETRPINMYTYYLIFAG
jgi:phage-related tail fiber protein